MSSLQDYLPCAPGVEHLPLKLPAALLGWRHAGQERSTVGAQVEKRTGEVREGRLDARFAARMQPPWMLWTR